MVCLEIADLLLRAPVRGEKKVGKAHFSTRIDTWKSFETAV